MTSEPAPVKNRAPVSPAPPGTDVMSLGKVENYRSERGARAYYEDHQRKLHRRWSDRRERRILREFLQRCGTIGSLLDVPCGFGRLFSLFAEHAREIVEADLSPTMLALNEELHEKRAAGYLECSALQIPRPDRSFDVVASIRLNHHLESQEARLAHIAELCRVADRAVVMTYFSSASLKDRLRRLRATFNKKRPKNTLSPREVELAFASHGFVVERRAPLSRLGSGHDYVLARRR